MLTDDEVLAVATAEWGAVRWDADHLLIPIELPPVTPLGWGVVIPLPSVGETEVWQYLPPEDARDSLQQLDVLVVEEVDTGAIHWAEQVEERGYRIFVLAPYGFRHSDPVEHERLLAASGPGGWHRDKDSRFR